MLKRYLDVLPPILMIVTDEEDRVLENIAQNVRPTAEVKVWNESFGILPLDSYIKEWFTLDHPEDMSGAQLVRVFKEAYKNIKSPSGDNLYYVILDADPHLKSSAVQRVLKNIAVSSNRNSSVRRGIVLISKTGNVPESLKNYVQVMHYTLPDQDDIRHLLLDFESLTRKAAQDPSLSKEEQDLIRDFTIPAGRDLKQEIPIEVLRSCEGMTSYQIRELLNDLLLETACNITLKDLIRKKREMTPHRGFLEVVSTPLTFDDIAGMDRLKVWLREAGASFTPEGRDWGLPPCKGVLLVGISGCGKSLTAKAIGSEMGLPVLRFDPGKVFGSRVGESEANMRRALEDMEAMSPCVIWIDEIEKGLAGIQSSARTDSGTTARVIGTFLSWYEEQTEDVFLVATANGLSGLPPEMISRFEEIFFVDLPDYIARSECFKIQLERYWREPMGDLSSIDVVALSTASKGMTGREIEKAVKEGLRHAFVRGGTPTTEHFLRASTEKPPISQIMREEIEGILEWVSYDPQTNEGVRARFASDPQREAEETGEDLVSLLEALEADPKPN